MSSDADDSGTESPELPIQKTKPQKPQFEKSAVKQSSNSTSSSSSSVPYGRKSTRTRSDALYARSLQHEMNLEANAGNEDSGGSSERAEDDDHEYTKVKP
jgi:hypothetical protein